MSINNKLKSDLKTIFDNRDLAMVTKFNTYCQHFTPETDLKKFDLLIGVIMMDHESNLFPFGLKLPFITAKLIQLNKLRYFESESNVIFTLEVMSHPKVGLLEKPITQTYQVTALGLEFYNRDLYR